MFDVTDPGISIDHLDMRKIPVRAESSNKAILRGKLVLGRSYNFDTAHRQIGEGELSDKDLKRFFAENGLTEKQYEQMLEIDNDEVDRRAALQEDCKLLLIRTIVKAGGLKTHRKGTKFEMPAYAPSGQGYWAAKQASQAWFGHVLDYDTERFTKVVSYREYNKNLMNLEAFVEQNPNLELSSPDKVGLKTPVKSSFGDDGIVVKREVQPIRYPSREVD